MKNRIILISLIALNGISSFADESNSSTGQNTAVINKVNNESQAGIVVVGGNSKTSAINLKEKTTYTYDMNVITNTAEYLRSDQNGIESARFWNFGLRYERELNNWLGVFAQQAVEGNQYAGYLQRYTTDLAPKFKVVKNEHQTLTIESGYQYRKENQVSGTVLTSSLFRLFSELVEQFNPSVSAKLSGEYLQSFETWSDRYLNGEISLNAAINSIFSVKTAYQAHYRQIKPVSATQNLDTLFTTALVAKF